MTLSLNFRMLHDDDGFNNPYILGSIYSAKANGAEQMFETNNLNQT